MRAILLFLTLLIGNFCFAQYPINGLVAQYGFDNGSLLVDGANGQNFTRTGTSLLEINNRFGNPSTSAVSLNGDHLTRPDIDFPVDGLGYGNLETLSFWIKTTTNSSDTKIIIDDSNRTSFATSNWVGNYVYLQDGKIGATLGVLYNGALSYRSGGVYTTKFVSDGNWHHVAVLLSNSMAFGGCCTTTIYNSMTIYIDGIHSGNGGNSQSSSTSISLATSHDTNGNITIGNNRSNSLPANNRYFDVVDDILFYNRILTATEISDIANYNFCYAPSSSNLIINTITQTDAGFNISGTGIYDIAYVPQSEPFGNAVIVSNVDAAAAAVQVTGLTPSTRYNVYHRSYCASSTNPSGWSLGQTFRTKGKMFINANATGSNDGSSWTNAFTSLQSAFAEQADDQEIWVAAGTYRPNISSRTVPFTINKPNVKLYGGFAGTEAQLSDRVLGTNETILSGDLSGNDDSNITYVNTTRNDNSYNVIGVHGENTILDRITITGGHANGTTGTLKVGAGIYKNNAVKKLTLTNCKMVRNIANESGGAIAAVYDATPSELIVSNCIFSENLSGAGGVIYSYTGPSVSLTYTFSNTLFSKNKAVDTATPGYAGSSVWLRAYGASSSITTSFIGCTFVDNSDTGTISGMNNFNRATLGLSIRSGVGANHSVTISNCILWNNKAVGGVASRPISGVTEDMVNPVTITNSIDETNFTGTTLSGTSSNTSASNPLFTNLAGSDYTLSTGSPAIDSGDNSKVIGATDLLGNQRIFNTTVDMGVYEFDSTVLSNPDFNPTIEFSMYPNPATSVLNIRSTIELKSIEIYSLEGKLVTTSHTDTIDISLLKSGFYIAKLIGSQNQTAVKKFIKK
ncbi:T9SS type A sorting domain-containing protein [Flavobacterium sp.]|uniref:T9SS type A sorting domain-containing protein n=1 Tax=Flavobacterium sp. TaxID=239 RepID=UPI003D6B01B6